MTTERAQTLYARRKGLIEPAFTMLATAFNLRVLWRAWAAGQSPRPLNASPLPI